MRRPLLIVAFALAIVAVAPTGRAWAQLGGGVGADPFSFYYGYYLPHAAAIAAQPTPLDTINAVNAQRSQAAQTDRSALYDPISPYGDEDTDPLAPYSSRSGGERRAKVGMGMGNAANGPSAVARGNGPALYYNRTANYFPSMRAGRGPNRNLAVTKRGGGMGGGMPSMPSGASMPGPR